MATGNRERYKPSVHPHVIVSRILKVHNRGRMMYSSYAVVADLFEAISATQNSCIMSMYTKYAMESSVIYECSTTRNSLAANISNSGAWGVLQFAQNNW